MSNFQRSYPCLIWWSNWRYISRKESGAIQEIVKQLSWECNISQSKGDIIEPYFWANSLFFKKFLTFCTRESILYRKPFRFRNENDIFRNRLIPVYRFGIITNINIYIINKRIPLFRFQFLAYQNILIQIHK